MNVKQNLKQNKCNTCKNESGMFGCELDGTKRRNCKKNNYEDYINENYIKINIPLIFGNKIVGSLKIYDLKFLNFIKDKLKDNTNDTIDLYEFNVNQNLEFFFGYKWTHNVK
jgi:hypothetical protein